ncbi:ribonuclease H-like domain-containing protein [Tanacetum coccineum]
MQGMVISENLGRYVVPTGRVIATVSIKVPTGRYIVPAGYIISPGLKDPSRAETYKWYLRAWRESLLKNNLLVLGPKLYNDPHRIPHPPFLSVLSPYRIFILHQQHFEPVFSVATTEPVFESQTSHSAQPSQNTQPQFQQYNSTTVSSMITICGTLFFMETAEIGSGAEYPRGKHNDSSFLSLWEEQIAILRETKKHRKLFYFIKPDFGGIEESKKMRKSMLKQEFADFKISESEGLHKGYDRFQKVAITLKTKGGLDFLSFDDLYNKLRTLEIDVKGGSSYDSRVPAAPTHSAFISAASTNSKWSTADSKYFDQIGKLDLEELDIKWQMAMLSVRINRFEKKAGRKFKFNNKDAARFDKKKVRCYQCSELGHFARECTRKKVDSKTRYSQFKIKELDKSEEPKALVSVDSMLNWSDHESEDMEKGVLKSMGMIAGYGMMLLFLLLML